ncbi:MAG: tetratricopeptide repeat protein [Ignavibacteriales bacterium]|nr:tetratricopeptide repeat protein [Ignavibacteriales bacterium]
MPLEIKKNMAFNKYVNRDYYFNDYIFCNWKIPACCYAYIYNLFGLWIFSTYQSILKKEYSALLIPVGIISLIIVMQFFFIPKYNYLNFDAWNNLADAEFQNKHYDAAISYARKSISIKENEISFYLLANCLAAKGDFNEAIINYKLALKLYPNSSMTYFNRGLLYAQQGIFEDAVKDFYKTIEIDPMFGEAYRNLAVIQFITENYEQALKSFNKYLTLTEDEQAKYTVKQDIIEIEKRLRNKEVKK